MDNARMPVADAASTASARTKHNTILEYGLLAPAIRRGIRPTCSNRHRETGQQRQRRQRRWRKTISTHHPRANRKRGRGQCVAPNQQRVLIVGSHQETGGGYQKRASPESIQKEEEPPPPRQTTWGRMGWFPRPSARDHRAKIV